MIDPIVQGDLVRLTPGQADATPLFIEAQTTMGAPPAGMCVSGLLSTTPAGWWNVMKKYEVPVGKVICLLSCEFSGATIQNIAAIRRRKKLGTLDLSTGVYTALSSVTPNESFEGLYMETATTISNATRTVTVTYTNQDGVTGRVSGPVTLSQTTVGQRHPFLPVSGDIGFIAVTNATRSAAATGTIDFYGYVTMAYSRQGVANQTYDYKFPNPDHYQILAGEEVVIDMQNVATTASQRDIYLKYIMRDAL